MQKLFLTPAFLSVASLLAAAILTPPSAIAADTSPLQNPVSAPHATPELNRAPYSDLASIQSKAAYEAFLVFARNNPIQGETIAEVRKRYAKYKQLGLERLRKVFDVVIEPQLINGVQTDVVTPTTGVSPANQNRILINLHGGGFQVDARVGGQLEATPIAALGRIKVIAIDYRQGPEFEFPAASEDVARVYQELLKSYRPENIGIYGCSAGAILTAQALAWFQKHDLPRPGAAAMIGAGGIIDRFGESNYIAVLLMGGSGPLFRPGFLLNAKPLAPLYYFRNANLADPQVNPADSLDVLKRFPPTLLISGTRDFGLSPVIYTHTKLLEAGSPASLMIQEGQGHCSFMGAEADPEVPEHQQAWRQLVRFFEQSLGSVESSRL